MDVRERNNILAELPARISVMGVPVDPWTMRQTVRATELLVESGAFAHLMGVNADKYLQMEDDPWMDQCVRGCEVVNADGASMVIAAERLNSDVPERVAGVDLMGELCSLAEEKSWPVFLLGAKEEVVHETEERLRVLYPGMIFAGARNGYFGDDEWGDVAEEVLRSGAKITFVGITSPKKERLIELFRSKGLTGAFVGVGGSFDVVSGNIPRAPKWVQQVKLEWAFRMLQEPKRLVKRYVVGNTRFMLELFRWRIGRNRNSEK